MKIFFRCRCRIYVNLISLSRWICLPLTLLLAALFSLLLNSFHVQNCTDSTEGTERTVVSTMTYVCAVLVLSCVTFGTRGRDEGRKDVWTLHVDTWTMMTFVGDLTSVT